MHFYTWRVFCMHPCACGRHLPLVVPMPDSYLLKCLWAALCGFPSLKSLVDLKADCHDVSSQTAALPFMCHCYHLFAPSVWITTLFPYLQVTDTDSLIKHCATVTGPEPPPKKMCSSLIFTPLIQSHWKGSGCMWLVTGWMSLFLTTGYVFI